MHFRILKMIATSGFLAALGCTKFNFGRGLQRSPRPPSWFKGPTSNGEGRESDGKGGEEKIGRIGAEEVGKGQRTGEWKGRGRDARVRAGKGGRRGGGKKSKNTPPSIPAYAPA